MCVEVFLGLRAAASSRLKSKFADTIGVKTTACGPRADLDCPRTQRTASWMSRSALRRSRVGRRDRFCAMVNELVAGTLARSAPSRIRWPLRRARERQLHSLAGASGS